MFEYHHPKEVDEFLVVPHSLRVVRLLLYPPLLHSLCVYLRAWSSFFRYVSTLSTNSLPVALFLLICLHCLSIVSSAVSNLWVKLLFMLTSLYDSYGSCLSIVTSWTKFKQQWLAITLMLCLAWFWFSVQSQNLNTVV